MDSTFAQIQHREDYVAIIQQVEAMAKSRKMAIPIADLVRLLFPLAHLTSERGPFNCKYAFVPTASVIARESRRNGA